MPTIPSITLPSGDEMPQLGLGTVGLTEETANDSITTALNAGIRHIDAAEAYQNESIIGDALASWDRDELFLTSKVLPKHLHYGSLLDACEATLQRLGTDYLDLYLIHWPNPAISLRESLDAMKRLHDEGIVRNVGVSNFSQYQLSCALHITDVPIAVNQFEVHPWHQLPDRVEYCQQEGVAVEAAAPLGRTEIFEDPLLQELAEKYGKTVAQISLKWAIENDITVIPKSVTPAHIRENAALFDWEIDDDDLAAIDEIDRQYPVYSPSAKDWGREIYGIPQ